MNSFEARVDYAAFVIRSRSPSSRHLDDCFENYDGDAVAAAIVRRAEARPELYKLIWRYICRETATSAAERLAGRNLSEAAAEMRAAAAQR